MRVAIADDSALFRQGLSLLLAAADIEVALEARSGVELITRMPAELPDAVILDIRMPPTYTEEGLEAAAEIGQRWPGLPVLLLSTYAEAVYAARLLNPNPAGRGYMLKDRVDTVAALVDALSRLCAGETVMDSSLVARLMSRPGLDDSLGGLSERERVVLELMAEGRSNHGIAAALQVSPKTVESHVASIFAKLALPAGSEDNRRVLAVLSWLRAGSS